MIIVADKLYNGEHQGECVLDDSWATKYVYIPTIRYFSHNQIRHFTITKKQKKFKMDSRWGDSTEGYNDFPLYEGVKIEV